MDRAGSPDIQTATGIGRYDDLWVVGELTGDDHPLLIAARERSDRLGRGGGADSEAGGLLLGEAPNRTRREQAPWGQGREQVSIEKKVFCNAQGKSQPLLPAVLGNEGDPGRTEACRGVGSHWLLPESDGAPDRYA